MRIPNLFFKTKTMKEKDAIFIFLMWMLVASAYYWRHELENINIRIKIFFSLLVVWIIIYEFYFADYSIKTQSEIAEEKHRKEIKDKLLDIKTKARKRRFNENLKKELKQLGITWLVIIVTLLIIWIPLFYSYDK